MSNCYTDFGDPFRPLSAFCKSSKIYKNTLYYCVSNIPLKDARTIINFPNIFRNEYKK